MSNLESFVIWNKWRTFGSGMCRQIGMENSDMSLLRKSWMMSGRYCLQWGLQVSLLCFSPMAWAPATAAKVRGVYPVGDWLSPNRSMLTFESPYGSTVVDYKINSDYDTIVWKVSEDRFEDGTSASVEGPKGVLFSTESGGDWGYSNSRGLSIFFLDYYQSMVVVSGKGDSYDRFDFGYDAFLIWNNKIFSYHCSFDLARFPGYRGIGPSKQFGPSDRIISRIGKFLAEKGVDPGLDRCEEKPELLNKPNVALAEQDMKEDAEARAAAER